MKNFKQTILAQIRDYKDQEKEGVEKYYIEENNYQEVIRFKHLKKDIFEVDLTGLNLDNLKEIYALFSMNFNFVKEVVELYMLHMENTQLTTTVNHQPTFDIENFRPDSFNYEIMIPLKDRNVIANKETIYTVRKGYNVYPSVQISMKIHVNGENFFPFLNINLPLARKERFLVKVDNHYNIQAVDEIIKKAIRQRVLCLLTTKRIKIFSRQDIREANFEDIGRYMTLIAMDSI